MTVSGRFPENSEILKTLRPHLFTCSSSCKIFRDRVRDELFFLNPSRFHLSPMQNAQAHLGQLILRLGFDTKARDVGVCEARRVLQLFHPADLRHGFVLLLLLLLRLRGRHLHFMLLVCTKKKKVYFFFFKSISNNSCVITYPEMCWR